jgi:hypothetical protein
MRRLLPVAGLAAVAFGSVLSAPAQGYRLSRIVPQPKLMYYVALEDWQRPMARVVKALNGAHVGVRLVLAKIPEQASIQVGRLEHRCGLPGVDGTTQTLAGGYAAIYLPRGCGATQASIIAGHELGHALGLRHEDRRCALMNSSGTGALGIPTRCLGRRHDWLRHPFRGDDIAGLRRLFHDTAPRVTLRLTGPATVRAGTPVRFAISAHDRERNLSTLTVSYGDGESDERDAGEALPTSHAFAKPGRYRIRAVARDFYLRRGTGSVTVVVRSA